MCRFLALWSEKAEPVSHWIISANNCLLNQSIKDISNRPNPDGWGFAYHNNQKFVVKKNAQSAFKEANYRDIASSIKTDLLFAHVRRKSQGPISVENTHPFTYHNWIFMHNGNIPSFEHYKRDLGVKLPKQDAIATLGTTDSEFLFRYFIYWFEKTKSCDVYCVLNLISSIIFELIELIDRKTLDQMALNFMLSNGEFIIGFRKNRTLFYRQGKHNLLISSEKLDTDSCWSEVPENHFIIAKNPQQIQLVAYDIELDKQSFPIPSLK
jgi:glutamine amidotransferase